VELVVTSPPYPMVEMWDEAFENMCPGVRSSIEAGRGSEAFEAMHGELDKVWLRCADLLCDGGLLCINVGDATRSLDSRFQLYSNHARIVQAVSGMGLTPLPDILWHKPTNSPTKFMGSGMLPPGAYVTYEHEYILIFRKGQRRSFGTAGARGNRHRSAYFWEERNRWFSDVWRDLRGTGQDLGPGAERSRSAAFPFELAYRLVCMFSVYGDTVFDPFVGTGTTMLAAAAAARNSVGVEWDEGLAVEVDRSLNAVVDVGVTRARARLRAHEEFVSGRESEGRTPAHLNEPHGFPVVTRQEQSLELLVPREVRQVEPGLVSVLHGPARG
jgi:DNA modification methylase